MGGDERSTHDIQGGPTMNSGLYQCRALGAGVVVVLLVACGGSGEVDERVEQQSLELGESGCTTTTSDTTVNNMTSGLQIVTPATYSNPGCFKAWVQDVTAANASLAVAVGVDAPVANASDCT